MLCADAAVVRELVQEEEDENVEENEEYREGKLRFAGGRKEEATYDAGDEEDKQIAADVRREAEQQSGEEEVRSEDTVLVRPPLFASKCSRLGCKLEPHTLVLGVFCMRNMHLYVM